MKRHETTDDYNDTSQFIISVISMINRMIWSWWKPRNAWDVPYLQKPIYKLSNYLELPIELETEKDLAGAIF